ncbi:MAG: hypothetical protein L0K08_06955, partial [Bifidobacterium mongoliense]|nr:hypothetical protein [Bifidobacterium mongoliense]
MNPLVYPWDRNMAKEQMMQDRRPMMHDVRRREDVGPAGHPSPDEVPLNTPEDIRAIHDAVNSGRNPLTDTGIPR